MKKHDLCTIAGKEFVIFPGEIVDKLAESEDMTVEEFLEEYDGHRFHFARDTHTITEITALNADGEDTTVVMIGLPDDFQRFLEESEPTFVEWYGNHPRKQEVGTGESFNEELFGAILAQYNHERKNHAEITRQDSVGADRHLPGNDLQSNIPPQSRGTESGEGINIQPGENFLGEI